MKEEGRQEQERWEGKRKSRNNGGNGDVQKGQGEQKGGKNKTEFLTMTRISKRERISSQIVFDKKQAD